MKSGPVTALFGAFDASQLPPEMQRPAPAPAPASPAASGLEVDAKPVVRQPPVTLNQPRPPTQTAHLPQTSRGPSARTEALAWAAVGVSGALALFGVLVFAWTMEILSLDDALLPVFAPFGAEAISAGDEPTLDDLRAQAKAAVERGDAGAGITLWSRVRARDVNDPLAKTEIPRLRSELGERQGT